MFPYIKNILAKKGWIRVNPHDNSYNSTKSDSVRDDFTKMNSSGISSNSL